MLNGQSEKKNIIKFLEWICNLESVREQGLTLFTFDLFWIFFSFVSVPWQDIETKNI